MKFQAILSSLAFSSITAAISDAPTSFIHPGFIVEINQLNFIKSEVKKRNEPLYSAYRKMENSKWGKKDYRQRGPPRDGNIECGDYPGTGVDIGCDEEDDDSMAAIAQALIWYVTGKERNGKKAIDIMNRYARNLVAHTNVNYALQSIWTMEKFPLAVEIMRYTGTGEAKWAEDDYQKFLDAIRTKYLPNMQEPAFTACTPIGCNGNWALAAIHARMGVAVVLDDKALFELSISQLRAAIPAYFYNFKLDGATPKTSPLIKPTWNNHIIFDQSTNGVSQETCRDFWHFQSGLSSVMGALETAFVQGHDLYPEFQTRLTESMELHASLFPSGFKKWRLPAAKYPKYYYEKPYKTNFCTGRSDKDMKGFVYALNPTWEIAYTAYSGRLKVKLPFSKKRVEVTRKLSYSGDAGFLSRYNSVFESVLLSKWYGENTKNV